MNTADQSSYDKIAELIHSDSSPVGIDAKKTHILILQSLHRLEERMKALEQKVDQLAHKP